MTEPPRFIVDDPARLDALRRYGILDTPPEPGFDDVVAIARALCGTSAALVSLVTAERQWFKARSGFEPCETPLSQSVCAHALGATALLVIPDLTRDTRTVDNTLVTGEPHLRFYAGAPLRTESGQVIGTICVLDGRARPDGLTAAQADGLRALARQVVLLLELRRAYEQRHDSLALQVALNGIGDALRDIRDIGTLAYTAASVMAQALGATRAGFGTVDPARETVAIEPDWCAPGISSMAGLHHFRDYGRFIDDLLLGDMIIIGDVAIDPRTRANAEWLAALQIRVLVNVPVIELGRLVAVLFVHFDRPVEWPSYRLSFIRAVADRTQAAVARIRAEHQESLLKGEIGHRLKNTLAMVQSIAVQSLKPVPDRAPVDTFMHRLTALSTAHDVLLQQDWSAAPMTRVLREALAIHVDGGRITMTGPELLINASAALSLTMLAHELATNATKYGALSTESGAVQIGWTVDRAGPQPQLTMTWRETGGRPVDKPSRRGFGSRLIDAGICGTRDVNMRYEATGLVAVFNAAFALVADG